VARWVEIVWGRSKKGWTLEWHESWIALKLCMRLLLHLILRRVKLHHDGGLAYPSVMVRRLRRPRSRSAETFWQRIVMRTHQGEWKRKRRQ